MRRILLGLDGSACAAEAARWAAGIAAATGAEVLAVHAAGLLSELAPGVSVPTVSHSTELQAAVHAWCEPLRVAKVPHEEVLVDGPPTLGLLRIAHERDADLVVVGTRGMGGAPGLLLGSTSHQLLQLAGRPVTVVPAPPSR